MGAFPPFCEGIFRASQLPNLPRSPAPNWWGTVAPFVGHRLPLRAPESTTPGGNVRKGEGGLSPWPWAPSSGFCRHTGRQRGRFPDTERCRSPATARAGSCRGAAGQVAPGEASESFSAQPWEPGAPASSSPASSSLLFPAQSLGLLPLPVTFPYFLRKLHGQKEMPTNAAFPSIKHSCLRLCKQRLEAADPSSGRHGGLGLQHPQLLGAGAVPQSRDTAPAVPVTWGAPAAAPWRAAVCAWVLCRRGGLGMGNSQLLAHAAPEQQLLSPPHILIFFGPSPHQLVSQSWVEVSEGWDTMEQVEGRARK